MKKRLPVREAPNRIAEARRAAGLTQAQLAERLGVHWVTLSKLERGKIQLHTGWMDAIAKELRIQASDLLAYREETVESYISGYIENGEYHDFGEHQFLVKIPLRSAGHEDNFWITVEGNSLWPNFHDGDLLEFMPAEPSEIGLYKGRFVTLQEEDMPILSGYVVSASKDGTCTLQTLNGPMAPDLKPIALAVLVQVRFVAPWDLSLSHDEKIERDLAISALKG